MRLAYPFPQGTPARGTLYKLTDTQLGRRPLGARRDLAIAADLARLVGQAEAQSLADDPTLQPAWFRS